MLKEAVAAGDTIEATVLRTDDGAGNILLSKKEATQVLAWDVLKGYLEDESVHKVRVKGIVNKGVVAYLEGIRGFIPASQLSLDYVEDCNPWLGKDLDVQVITVDAEKQKLVMSAKTVLRKQQEEARNHKISMLIPGSVVEGTVESLMPYGAFINLGDGLSGLVHISQICQKRIKHPGEVLKEGEKVQAKILNTNDNKISLSMKVLQEEMVDTEAENAEAIEYTSDEQATTNLGSLLAGLMSGTK
jgi:small subunit ribosomal protein S1